MATGKAAKLEPDNAEEAAAAGGGEGQGDGEGTGTGTGGQTPASPAQSATGTAGAGAVSAYFTNLADNIVSVPPYLGRARTVQVCKSRDKENLLGEIIDLKEALLNGEIHLAEHRHEYVRRVAENRKLERRVQDLELAGNYDAPRTGGVCRLEARARGLEAQYELLTDTIALRKHTELYELSRNLNTTRTREVKIERDVCASEIGRLRMVLNHLKLLYAKAQEENGDWIMCKKHLEKLTIINPKLQKTVDSLQESVKKGKADIKAMKAKAKEAASTIKRAQSKYSSLESQISGLGSQIKSAEDTKKQKLRKLHQVGFERMKFNKQFKDENPNVSLGTKS